MGTLLVVSVDPWVVEAVFLPSFSPGGGVILEPILMGAPLLLAVVTAVDGVGRVLLMVVVP